MGVRSLASGLSLNRVSTEVRVSLFVKLKDLSDDDPSRLPDLATADSAGLRYAARSP
jgi:hypothetical protein